MKTSKNLSFAFVIFVLVAVITPLCFSQCEYEWKQGQGIPGVDGEVDAVTTWDPDGAGPKPELLVVGGSFTIAGETFANNIATWDGNSWQPLGSGISGPYQLNPVYALTVYNGELIAAGPFTTAGGVTVNYIARWDGSSWQTLGSGMNRRVCALTVYNGELIAGGAFTTASGVSTRFIARWNGSTWQPLGSGVDRIVTALTIYNEELIAGGQFTTAGGVSAPGVARWNGSTWQALGSGIECCDVYALTVYDGQLIAGGWFTTAGGVSASNIARWNGSNWLPLGSGINYGVNTLTVYNGELIAGGRFTTAGDVSANQIARWNGSTWQSFGSGMHGMVCALTVYNGELIAGGRFTTAGGVSARCIARWNGSTWQLLGSGMDSSVNALMVYNGELIAGGWFTIARWNGSSWQALGSGMDSSVNALTVYNGELIAGGRFTTAGGVSARCIARWNGSTWQPLGSGMDGQVSSLTVYNGELIAGGWFTTAGGIDARSIARWNGSTWQSLGSGIYYGVNALTVYNGELIAGGWFGSAGDVDARCIARWNGSAWQPLGNGMGGCLISYPVVNTLTVYNGELIAGGNFCWAGGVSADNIARWNGSTWQPLGDGTFGDVESLTVYNSELVAGGDIYQAGRVRVNYIARWNGSTWQPLGSGMNALIYALTVYNGELIAGGGFTTAGGKLSAFLARWGPPAGPDANEILQGEVTLISEVSDSNRVDEVYFYIREPNDGNGVSIGYDELALTLNTSTGNWEYAFDTMQLPGGEYVALAEAVDICGQVGWSGVVPFSIHNNHIPIANAGPDQTVYADENRVATVSLDASGSYDEDGDELTYLWTWTIDGDIFDANGVNPTIELPVGQHTIQLVVNDGIEDSEPNTCLITVQWLPVETNLRIMPRTINRDSHQKWLLACISFPKGITKNMIDMSKPLLLNPGGIEASRKFVYTQYVRGVPRTNILAFFDKNKLMNVVPGNGLTKLQITGELKTGRPFTGSDTVRIIGRRIGGNGR